MGGGEQSKDGLIKKYVPVSESVKASKACDNLRLRDTQYPASASIGTTDHHSQARVRT